MNNMNKREMVSALADGELSGPELEQALATLLTDPEAAQAWETYHLVGDTLRAADLAPIRPASAFVARLSARLAAEPVPQALALSSAPSHEPIVSRPAAVPAANDSSFRWKLVAGFASVAAALSVGWTLMGAATQDPVVPQLAEAPAGGGLVMIRHAQLDELLAAHQQLGGSGALQMPASFVRQVTFESPAR